MPEFVEPMLARLVSEPPSGDWVYEIKFDGYRTLALKGGPDVQLLSRNRLDLTRRFPEVAEALAELPVGSAVLDGEIVALESGGLSSFQLLQASEASAKRPPIHFYAFDLPFLEGEDLRSLPLLDRKKRLEAMLPKDNGLIRFSATLGSDSGKLLAKARKLGLEGLIGKRPGSSYESGRRSGAWIKLKLHQEQEMVIGGYTTPNRTRQHFGALLVGYYDDGQLRYAGKVGTGFADATLAALHSTLKEIGQSRCPFADLPETKRSSRYGIALTPAEMKRCHWVEPKLVGQVRFSSWTRDGKLRHPVFLGLRADKNARDVVRERAAAP
jgi:bifunctional non-homologous end joining protein LigD